MKRRHALAMPAVWGEELARRAMRGPRYLPEPSLVEISVRTIQSRFLLLLTKIVAETIIGPIPTRLRAAEPRSRGIEFRS